MDPSKLLQELNGRNPIEALETFSQEIESSSEPRKLIFNLLQTSPKCDDVLKLLNREKPSKAQLATIFHALGCILMSLDEDGSFQSVSLHITRWVLQNHSNILINLLSPSNTIRCITAALHFITGMVVSGSAATNEVLTHLEMDRIKFSILTEKIDEMKTKDVRTSMFYLILAFLNTGDNRCLRQFLQNVEFVTCIFEGLPADPSKMVIKLLTLLHEVVVLNMNISKTTKVRMFNDKSCKFLMNLYFHHPSKEAVKDCYSSEEKESIKRALHKLMITLCSDIRHGVIFRDKDDKHLTNVKSNNLHVYLILKSLQFPWELKEGRELICKILIACPDVTHLFARLIDSYLEPRPSSGFFSLVKLFILLIEKREPWKDIENQLQKGVVKDCSLLIPFVTNKMIRTTIESSSNVLRHAGILLLLSLFIKAKETIDRISLMTAFTDSLRDETKTMILNGVERLGGGVNKISSQWNMCVNIDGGKVPKWYADEYPSKLALLADITQLFCHYAELFGYNKIREKTSPLQMLQKVQNLSNKEIEKDVFSHQKVRKLILELILIAQKTGNFEAFGFLKDEGREDEHVNVNETLFHQLMNVYCSNARGQGTTASDNVKRDLQDLSLKLLSASLDCWGLSSYCENNIKIWLDTARFNEQTECLEFLAKVISKSVSNLYSYLDVLITLDAETHGEFNKNNNIDLIEKVSQMDVSVELEDNEDVMTKEMAIPFSCLILGAIDVLKTNPDPRLVKYFSSVVDEYIHRLSNPKPLAEHLSENEDILTTETKRYLKSWVSEDPVTDVNISDDNILSKLKVLFMTKTFPSASSFCNEIKNQIKDNTELVSICERILLYAQFEINSSTNLKVKKKGKFYLKVLRSLHKIPQTESEFERFSDVFECLLNHPFILSSYKPFTSSDFIHIEVENILSIVIENYPDLHHHLRPFLEKMIMELESLPVIDVSFGNSASIYLSTYNQLTYDDIEKMVQPLLSCLSFPYSETRTQLLRALLELLTTHSTAKHQPSKELTCLLLSKTISLSRRKDLSDQEQSFISILSKALSVFLSCDVVQDFKQDELKSIMNCKPFDAELCSHLLRIQPSIASVLAKKLEKVETDFPNQASFVLELLREEKCYKYTHSYLLKVKDELHQWVLSSDSEMNDVYRDILEYVLQNNMFELSEVSNVCNSLFRDIISTKSKLPHHFLSIIPFFHHLSRTSNIDLKGSPHPDIQLLSLLFHGVAKAYKKNENLKFMGRVGNLILSFEPRVDTSSVRREFYGNKLWLSFVKQILKSGLVDPENGAILLKCVIRFSKIIYSKKKKEEGVLPPNILYQMLRSHSHFIPIMLNPEEEFEGIKEQVVLLQLILVEYAPNVCEERHVPILLGSYGAMKSTCDQAILKILYLYEQHGFMPTYDPTLWGRIAITHFAIEKGPGVNVVYRTPKHYQILSLLDDEKVIQTALNFDMELELEPNSFGRSDPSLYDQRFLLLVFMHITRNNPQLDVMQLVEKGVLAIGLAALSSHYDDVWAVGATLLKNVVWLFQESRYRNRKHEWIWFVHILGNGLESKKTRLPSLMVHFLVRASQLFFSPKDVMYKPVMNYLWLKPSLPLFKVPELYVMFFSDDVQHSREHRAFFLHLLASGIRDNLDYKVCQSSYVPKLILGLITSPTINTRLRILALSVLKAMVEVPDGAESLVLQQSLLVELPLALEPTTFCPPEDARHWIDAVVAVLNSLWRTWKTTKINLNKTSTPVESTFGSGAKRKVEESSNDDVGPSLRITKRRKTSNGEITEADDSKSKKRKEEKERTQGIAGFTEFFICLGRVVPKVISDGTVDSLSKCFSLLNEVLVCSERLRETSNSKTKVMNSGFLKQQVKLWIDESVLMQRFRGHSTDDEGVLFVVNNSSQDWKHKPLKRKAFEENEQFEEIEKKKQTKNLLQATEQLFCVINSESPS